MCHAGKHVTYRYTQLHAHLWEIQTLALQRRTRPPTASWPSLLCPPPIVQNIVCASLKTRLFVPAPTIPLCSAPADVRQFHWSILEKFPPCLFSRRKYWASNRRRIVSAVWPMYWKKKLSLRKIRRAYIQWVHMLNLESRYYPILFSLQLLFESSEVPPNDWHLPGGSKRERD